MTKAGPVEMPGEIGGLVALDEIVVHGWDLARRPGSRSPSTTPALEAVHGFAAMFSGPGTEEQRAGGVRPRARRSPPTRRCSIACSAMLGRDAAWRPPA